VVVGLASDSFAADDRPDPAKLSATIDKGLEFLVKDALAWKEKHNCASCHHAALVVWSLREAKLRGHAVDEPVLAEMTQWISEAGERRFELRRRKEVPRALNTKPLYYTLALQTDPRPDDVTQA